MGAGSQVTRKKVSADFRQVPNPVFRFVLHYQFFFFSKSFMLSTLGFMCVAFVTGALAWWGPTFIHRGIILQPGSENVTLDE